MAQIIAVKTKYQDRLEQVYKRLWEGKRKVASVGRPDGLALIKMLPTDNGRTAVRIKAIGCNSFGIEVLIDGHNIREWTALEQFSKRQQIDIANCIQWNTLQ